MVVRAKPPHSRCRIPPLAYPARGSRQLRRPATRPNEEEPTTVDDLDPAPGAMPMSQEKSFAQPCGGRRRGRPRGARNKATLALEAVLEGAAEELTRMLIAKALAGDGAALRFCLQRLLPARRDRPVMFDLPAIETAGDLAKASQAVVAACAGGILSPCEAAAVMDLITSARAIVETARRMTAWDNRLQACAARISRARAMPCERRASSQARAASSRRETFGVWGCEIDKGIRAPRRVVCRSPVFNSTTRLAGWAKSPAAAARLILSAARFCPRGVPSIRVRTARVAPFAHATGSASTRSIRGPPAHHASTNMKQARGGTLPEPAHQSEARYVRRDGRGACARQHQGAILFGTVRDR
jgi:hypothetical protein